MISPAAAPAKRPATSTRRPAHDLLELLRQLPADGDRPIGQRRRERSRASPASDAATRTRRPATATAPAPPTAPRAPPLRAAGSRRTGSAPPRTRSRPGPSRPPTAPAGPSRARRPRAPPHQPRARVADPRQPRIGDQRHPLARGEPRQHLGRPLRLVVLVVADEPRRDAVPLEQHAACGACPRTGPRRPRASSRSRRSVTSSRLPIGVAQTASGISPLLRASRTRPSPRRSSRPTSRARRGRSGTSRAPTPASRGRRRPSPDRKGTRPRPQSRRRSTISSGLKMLTRLAIPEPRCSPCPFRISTRLRISLAGEPDEAVRVRGRPERSLRRARRRPFRTRTTRGGRSRRSDSGRRRGR